MSDVLLVGDGLPFEFGGARYLLAPRLDFRGEAAFATWLAADAWHALERQADTLGPAQLAEQRQGWRHDLAARAFDFGAPVALRALGTAAGVARLAVLLSQQVRPGADGAGRTLTPEDVDRVRADPGKWQELQERVLDAAVPNWRGPGPGAGPAPGSAPSGSSPRS